MEEKIKVEIPVDEWMKMERNHEMVEDFLMSIDIIGYENAEHHLLEHLQKLIEEVSE